MTTVKELEPWLLDYAPGHGDLALDIGANEGAWSRLLLERGFEVHAFEPQALPALRAIRGLRLIEVAIGDSIGELALTLFDNSAHATAVESETNAFQHIRGASTGRSVVPMMTIDGLGYSRRSVDFIKVDVEGAEVEVIRGGKETIAHSHPMLLIEIHSARAGEGVEEWLKSQAYQLVSIPHPYPEASHVHRWIRAEFL